MPSSAFLMIRTLFLQLLLFSVALSIATPIGIPVRPVIPVHPEPIPARPGSGRPTPGHPNGSEPGSPPPRLGTEPPPQPGPIETIEETISLVTDLLEAFAPDSPDTDIGTNPQKPIDLTQPLLPQLGLSPTQLETSTACLKTCLAPLDTIVGADVCVAQIKGTLQAGACVCSLDGAAAKMDSCYTECLPRTVILPTNAKPSIRCSRIAAQVNASTPTK